MNKKYILLSLGILLIVTLPSFVSAYSDYDTKPYPHGNEAASGPGTAYGAGDETDGEARCYVDSPLGQTEAQAGLYGYDLETGYHTWTVSVDASLQCYMTCGLFGSATIRVYVQILDGSKNTIESLLVWERTCSSSSSKSFDDESIDEDDTFSSTNEARYFGVVFCVYAGNGATICQDSTHTSSGYPAVLTVDMISWSY